MSNFTLHPGFTKPETHLLPEGWVAKPLSCFTTTRQGGKLGLTKESHYVSNGVHAFSAAGCDGFVEEVEYKETEAVVLSAIGANCGRCFFASGNWTTLANVQAIIPNEEVDPKYLFYRVNQENFWERSGSAQPFIKPSSIGSSWVAFPRSKIRQKKIANILTGIDTAIEKTEALIAKCQQIKAGLMHDLFTRGVLPNGQLRPPREQTPELYQETAIGWIPKDWECQRLGLILEKSGGYLQTGPFGSQLHAAEYQNEGVPVVMPQDINDGLIQTTSIARISESRAASLARHRLKLGDIIIARRGELSRAAAVGHTEIEWICGTGCFLLRLGRTDLNHYFFSHVYRHDLIQRQVAGMQVGSTMPSLNNDVMSRLLFPFPNATEQGEITLRLDLAERKIVALQNELSKLKQQKSGLMHDLLTGKMPVIVEDPEVVDG